MKTTMAGPDGVVMVGSIIDIDLSLAESLVNGGFAKAVESAMVSPPEKAIMQKTKARRGKK